MAMAMVCDNCGAERDGRFCATCGQNDRNYLRAVIPVIGDFFATTFDLDSRMFRTLRALFFKPGFLAEEFSANRRAAYVPPLRLYLIASVVFFLVLQFELRDVSFDELEANGTVAGEVAQGFVDGVATELDDLTEEERREVEDALRRAGLEEVLDPNAEVEAVVKSLVGLAEEDPADVVASDEEGTAAVPVVEEGAVDEAEREAGDEVEEPENDEISKLKQVLGPESARKIDAIVERWGVSAFDDVSFDLGEEPSDFEIFIAGQFVEAMYRPEQALDQLVETVPVVMFFVLPVFAFGLKILYFTKHRYYVEHLVFATHVHTIAFVAFTVLLFDLSNLVDFAIFMLLFVHYFISLKRYYRDSFGWAFSKFVFALFGYNVLLIPASMGVFFGTLLLV